MKAETDNRISTRLLADIFTTIERKLQSAANHPSEQGAEQALRESEARFRAIFEHAPIGVSLTDAEGRHIANNRMRAEMLGYSEQELHGRAFAELTHPEDVVAEMSLFGELVRGERDSYQIEKRYIHKDGRIVWAHVTVAAVRNADGSPSFTIGMVQDVTERKRTDEALRESEERSRTIFSSAAIAISIADMEGRFVQTNAAYRAMLGYSEPELHAMTFAQITHPDDIEADVALFQELSSGKLDSYQLEKRYVRKDGSVVWGRLHVSLIRDREGKPQYDVGMMEDITERKRVENQLKHQALHDSLTDLPNRALLQDRLEQAIRKAKRDQAPAALLLMDLDRFKEVNDTFGHHYGDLLLREVSRRLQATLRESDTVARLGGDEFAVLLPGADATGALLTAEKILRILDLPFVLGEQRLDLSASIGIALYPEHGDDAITLLRLADVAMYAAKRSGNGHGMYEPEHDQHSPERLALVSKLREAIADNQLVLHYQPKVDLATGVSEQVEALVRWDHPERGLIPPGEFIPLAEHSGLIKPLTLWALNAALRQCRLWYEDGMSVKVAVNLSGRNLSDPEMVDTVARLIGTWMVPPSLLQVEITETAVMADPTRGMETLTRLHSRGVSIAMDDFGTGYSSLGYLKRLPVDEIKVDRSFVMDMTRDHDDAFIARAVVDLGHNLGLRVVAEGVEDQETLDALRSIGCDMAQGYFFSRPLPAQDLADWLRQRAMSGEAASRPLRVVKA